MAEVRGVHSRRLGQGPAVEHQEEGIEQEEVPAAARIDHPGLGQDGQHVGRAGQGVGRLTKGALHHAHQAGPVPRSDRRRVGHRQDRPLDRAHHRPPGQLGGVADGVHQDVGADAALLGARHPLAHAPEELREDHARVPPGAHQGAVADGLAHLGQPGPRLDALELGDHRFEGQGHVGARVPVGHRVDVEAVDVGLVQAQGVPVAPHHGAQVIGAERRRGGHGRGC